MKIQSFSLTKSINVFIIDLLFLKIFLAREKSFCRVCLFKYALFNDSLISQMMNLSDLREELL